MKKEARRWGEGTRKKVGELEIVCSEFAGMTQIFIRLGRKTLS